LASNRSSRQGLPFPPNLSTHSFLFYLFHFPFFIFRRHDESWKWLNITRFSRLLGIIAMTRILLRLAARVEKRGQITWDNRQFLEKIVIAFKSRIFAQRFSTDRQRGKLRLTPEPSIDPCGTAKFHLLQSCNLTFSTLNYTSNLPQPTCDTWLSLVTPKFPCW
jgi:hypothetical protein